MLRKKRLFLVPVLALTSLWLGIPAATANNLNGCNYGDTTQPCYTDDTTIKFYYDLGLRMTAAVEATRTQSYGTLFTTYTTTHDNSDNHYFIDDALPSGIYGLYKCISWLDQLRCDHAHIRFHGEEISGFADSQLQALACHETGHSVGLLHPVDVGEPNDPNVYYCMIQGGYPNKPRFLGSHNVGEIKKKYF